MKKYYGYLALLWLLHAHAQCAEIHIIDTHKEVVINNPTLNHARQMGITLNQLFGPHNNHNFYNFLPQTQDLIRFTMTYATLHSTVNNLHTHTQIQRVYDEINSNNKANPENIF